MGLSWALILISGMANLASAQGDLNPVKLSKKERRKICQRYQGQYVSHFGTVYRIENCKRRVVASTDFIFRLTERGQTIKEIDNHAVIALPLGRPYKVEIGANRACAQLEGQYVTYSFVEVYFVERCQKRPFTDWVTYLDHRGRRATAEILALNWVEFNRLKLGKSMPSVALSHTDALLGGQAGVDVIPIDEACRGVNGRFVTYYSRVYKIEKCRKRELDPTKLLAARNRPRKMIELSSEQWLSIPDGQPLP